MIAGCVTTTTGRPEPEVDEKVTAERFLQLGAQYLRNGSYELARDRLLTALKYDPKLALAHSTLALTYVQLENNRLAAKHFDLAIHYEPKNFDIRNAYAVYLCQQKQFDEAKKQFDRAIDAYDNDNAEVMLTNAGVCMASKPDYEMAEAYFREALEFKSSYGEALLQLSVLKYKTGNSLHARAFLQRYLVNNRATSAVLFLGSQIERELGDERAATAYENQIIQDFPDSSEAQFLLRNR
jgi:type IV pilus assembly protein PilF